MKHIFYVLMSIILIMITCDLQALDIGIGRSCADPKKKHCKFCPRNEQYAKGLNRTKFEAEYQCRHKSKTTKASDGTIVGCSSYTMYASCDGKKCGCCRGKDLSYSCDGDTCFCCSTIPKMSVQCKGNNCVCCRPGTSIECKENNCVCCRPGTSIECKENICGCCPPGGCKLTVGRATVGDTGHEIGKELKKVSKEIIGSLKQICEELDDGGKTLKLLPATLNKDLKPLFNLPEQLDAAKPKIVSSIAQIVGALKQVSQQKASLAAQSKKLKSYGLTSVGTDVSQALDSLEQALKALAQVDTQKIDKAAWAQRQFREESRPMTRGPQPKINFASLWNEEFKKLIGQPGVCKKGVLCGYLHTISSSSADARKTLPTIKDQVVGVESKLDDTYRCGGLKSQSLAEYMLNLATAPACKG